MNAIPNEQEQHETDEELLACFVELINSGDLIAVARPDGQVGWMPAPIDVSTTRICRICGGSGFLSPAIASIVTPDFRLENMCPDCHGTGVNQEVNERTPTEPLANTLDSEDPEERPEEEWRDPDDGTMPAFVDGEYGEEYWRMREYPHFEPADDQPTTEPEPLPPTLADTDENPPLWTVW